MRLSVDVSAREDIPPWLAYGAPVFTVIAALVVGSVTLVAVGVNPLAAYVDMFVVTATQPFGILQTLTKAIPLVLAGLAVYLPLRANLWNIGAQGQIYLGAIVGTWVGINVDGGAFTIPLLLVGAAVGGGLWGAVPGWLRAVYGVNEIITTLMMTFIATLFTNYLVRGPMQGGSGNFPQSASLPQAAQLPFIVGPLHVGIVVALLLTVAVWVLIKRTRLGYEIVFTGSNPDAAEQAGMDRARIYFTVLVLGGALAGLAGVVEIAGIQYRLRPGFSPGYGFTAIPIALLGRNGALQVLVASLFFALVFVGGSTITVNYGVPASIVSIIQALIILFLITAEFVKQYSVSLGIERAAAGASVGEGA